MPHSSKIGVFPYFFRNQCLGAEERSITSPQRRKTKEPDNDLEEEIFSRGCRTTKSLAAGSVLYFFGFCFDRSAHKHAELRKIDRRVHIVWLYSYVILEKTNPHHSNRKVSALSLTKETWGLYLEVIVIMAGITWISMFISTINLVPKRLLSVWRCLPPIPVTCLGSINGAILQTCSTTFSTLELMCYNLQ